MELWGASDWLLRVVLPVLVAVLFIGVLLYERGASDVDLRVYAPTHVSPGSPIPVRAFVFEGIRGAELPSIGSRPIALSSQAIEPPAQAGAPLTASQVAGAAGRLPAPPDEGEHRPFPAPPSWPI